MLARLENRLKLLTGGARDLPARQQTLRGAIEWSYDLLGQAERVLCRRLAVFAGGCTLEAIESICSGEGELELDLLDGLGSLVEKSLLRQEEHLEGEPRFVMLETIHEYAHEKLEESVEAEVLRSRHAAHFLALAEEAAVEMTGPQQAIWFERMARERENFRRALEWSQAEAGRAEVGLRLAGALGWFWHGRGYLREGSEWLERMLNRATNPDAGMRLQALHYASVLHYLQGNDAQAHLFAEQNLRLARQTGESEKIARAYYAVGLARFAQQEYSTADALLAEGVAHAEQTGERATLRALLHLRAEAARAQHDFERARVLYQEALALAREVGSEAGVAWELVNLGYLALTTGDHAAAARYGRESLQRFIRVGDRRGMDGGLTLLAAAHWAPRRPQRAATLLGAAQALREAINVTIETVDREPFELSHRLGRSALSEEAYQAAFAEGRKLPLELALAAALEEDEAED